MGGHGGGGSIKEAEERRLLSLRAIANAACGYARNPSTPPKFRFKWK